MLQSPSGSGPVILRALTLDVLASLIAGVGVGGLLFNFICESLQAILIELLVGGYEDFWSYVTLKRFWVAPTCAIQIAAVHCIDVARKRDLGAQARWYRARMLGLIAANVAISWYVVEALRNH